MNSSPHNSCDNILFNEVVISDRNQQTQREVDFALPRPVKGCFINFVEPVLGTAVFVPLELARGSHAVFDCSVGTNDQTTPMRKNEAGISPR